MKHALVAVVMGAESTMMVTPIASCARNTFKERMGEQSPVLLH